MCGKLFKLQIGKDLRWCIEIHLTEDSFITETKKVNNYYKNFVGDQ